MALSGSVSTDSYQGRYLKLSWEATQDIAKNTSTIKWTLKGAGTASSSWYKAGNFYVKIAGKVVYEKESGYRITLYNGTEVASGSLTVSHGTDGKKEFSVSVKGGIYTYARNVSGSKSFTLDTIPRKATLASAPDFNDEGNPKITYSNLAGSSVTTLQACIANSTGGTIYAAYRDITKTGTSYTFNLTDAERTALRKACTGKSMKVRFYIKTIIAGTTYTHYLEKTMSMTNAAPSISATVIDSNATTVALTGNSAKFINGYSNAAYTITASGKKNATISSYKAENGSQSKTTASGAINKVTSGKFKFTTTDSRGYSNSTTLTKTLIDYFPVSCSIKITQMTVDGTFKLTITGQYFNGSFGDVSNAATVQYRITDGNGTYGSWTTVTPSFGTNTYTATKTFTGLDYQKEYNVQARITDKLSSKTSEERTAVCNPVFDWSKSDFRIHTPLYMDNAKQIYGRFEDGTAAILASVNTSNQMFFGYGTYNAGLGSSYFDGNVVYMRSKGNISHTASGTIGGNKAWTNSSDERLKTGIEEIPPVFAQIWMELTPKMFEWNELNFPDGKKQFGLIAQEAIEVFEKYGVDYKELGFIEVVPVEEAEYFAITYEHYHMLTAQVLKNTISELSSLKEDIAEIKQLVEGR